MKKFPLELASFKDLFEDKKIIIPSFQRDYIWEKDNWEEWLQDVKYLIDCEDFEEIHFIGSIVFKKIEQGDKNNNPNFSSYPEYEIIDGQQRITTFFVFSLALLKFLDEDTNSFLKERINRTLFAPDKTPRLIMKGEDETSLEGILKYKNQEDKDKRIFEAYQWFLNSLKKDNLRKYSLETIFEKLKRKINFILIKLTNTDDALEIFKSINTSGSLLTSADLLKAELFNSWEKGGLDKKTLSNKWEELKEKVGKENLNHFFYTFLSIQHSGGFTENKFHSYFREKVLKQANSVKELWDKIATVSEIYNQILSPTKDYWGKDFYLPVLERKILGGSKYLRQLYPLIITLKEKGLQGKEEANALQKLIVYFFRKTIKEKRIRQNEIFRLINLISNNINWLQLIFNDPQIIEEIEESDLFWNKLEKKLKLSDQEVKFLLNKFYLKFIPEGYTPDELQLEHMFPKKPDKDWWLIPQWENLNKEQRQEKLFSLGNHTLLTASKNISANNKTWEKKREEFREKSCLRYEENGLKLIEKSILLPTEIDNRKKYLINSFKKNGILFIDEKKEKPNVIIKED